MPLAQDGNYSFSIPYLCVFYSSLNNNSVIRKAVFAQRPTFANRKWCT